MFLKSNILTLISKQPQFNMHHFIFPSKDTFITNLKGLDSKNFGIDEVMDVDVQSYSYNTLLKYQTASVSSSSDIVENAVNFIGTVVGQFSGSTFNVIQSDDNTGNIIVVRGYLQGSINYTTSSYANIVTDSFTGNFTGSVIGHVSSATINGISYSNEFVSASAMSSGSVEDLSGSVSGSSVIGDVSGQAYGEFNHFSGSLNTVSGTMQGSVSGSYCYYSPHFKINTTSYLSRTLLKFDISSISSSIHNGDIVDPKFTLTLKTLKESEVPIDYTVYAYAVSQSWDMGNGRYEEGGSDYGSSWNYRNYSGGTRWYPENKSTQLVDYLTNESYKSVAFGNGGGTWYYSVPSTFTQPTSSVATPFFTEEISVPTFDQAYSSSLNTNLSSSFNDILSQSLSEVLSASYAEKFDADASNDLLRSIAVPTYEYASSSISSSLASMDQTASAQCSNQTYYQIEYSSSVAFLETLSSSIQSILQDSASVSSYSDNAYLYDIYLSSSMSSLAPTTFDDVYSILNQWSYDAHSSSNYVQNINTVYLGFSSSLYTKIGSTDPNVVYVNEGMYPYLYTSSIDLLNAQFTSSATDDFSSSLINYLNDYIHEVELETSASVAGSIVRVFVSPYLSTLAIGSSLIESQSFSYQSSDITMDVTDIVKAWIVGCVPNEGIILLSSEELTQSGSNSQLGFFSRETNTIYSPYLDVQWDDSEFVTGTLEPITDNVPYVATIRNLKKEYKHNSIVRVNVFARDKFSLKNFVKATQQSVHLTPKYLPETTYYAIKDTETDEIVLDFDEGTKLSCDENGNYFIIDMSGLPQERYFKILLKVELNGSVEIIDNNTYFKVIR